MRPPPRDPVELCLLHGEVAAFRAAIGYDPDPTKPPDTSAAIEEVRRLYRASGGTPLPDPRHTDYATHSYD